MSDILYTSLQLREVFHLEFLRWLNRKIKVNCYSLKGGVNLRFFFNSFRYSEDIDLDIRGITVKKLKDTAMDILESSSFQDTLKPFGIQTIVPPDISKVKQTETTQRFKVHLLSFAGEDLFTKVEFSRRGFKGEALVEPVQNFILREYKLPPLLVSHYDASSAIRQKIETLPARSTVQARDIFDLYILHSQYKPAKTKIPGLQNAALAKAHEKIFEVSFEQFRDTVISYLSAEDQRQYNSPSLWDEIRIKTAHFIDELGK